MDMAEWHRTTRGAALISVFSNTLLVVLKIGVGIFTGSVAIISEGIHSGMDLLAALIAFISVSISGQPADGSHPYGHGKVENVSGTIEAALILAAGFYIIYESVHELQHGGEVINLGFGLAVMAVSVIVNIIVSRNLFIVAKEHDSPALEADAHHLSTDVYTSLGVFAGLLIVSLTGMHWLDPVVAIIVACMIIYIGAKVLAASFRDLLDQRLPEEEERIIREVLEDYEHLSEFVSYHRLRTRKAGAQRYIDLHLVVPAEKSVAEAHEFCDHIESDLKSRIKNANITIHIEPPHS